MKFFYNTLFLLLLNGAIVFSQVPVITSAVNPVVGDNYSGYLVDTNAIDLSLTGVNITWDYSTLIVPSTAFSTFSGQTVASTPQAASYASASVSVYNSDDNSYTYFTTSSAKMELNGFASTSTGATILSNPATLITFPFTYNSTVNDNFSGTQRIGIATFSITGTSVSVADAYGTLILPSGTYSNVLRVKAIQNGVAKGIGGNVNSTFTTYYWYGEGYKHPLLEFDIIIFTGTGIYSPAANSYEKKAFVITPTLIGINEKPQKSNFDFNVFPNPVTNRTSTFSFNLDRSSIVSISLVNVLGQEQTVMSDKEMQQGIQNEVVSFTNLSRGIYLAKLSINGIVSQKKIIIN